MHVCMCVCVCVYLYQHHGHTHKRNPTPPSSGQKRRSYISLDLGGDPLYLELQTVFEDFKPVERTVRERGHGVFFSWGGRGDCSIFFVFVCVCVCAGGGSPFFFLGVWKGGREGGRVGRGRVHFFLAPLTPPTNGTMRRTTIGNHHPLPLTPPNKTTLLENNHPKNDGWGQVEMRSSRRTLGYREVERVLPLNAQVIYLTKLKQNNQKIVHFRTFTYHAHEKIYMYSKKKIRIHT